MTTSMTTTREAGIAKRDQLAGALRAIGLLTDAYPRSSPTPDTVKIYCEELAGYSAEALERAAREHIRASTWYPTIAELLSRLGTKSAEEGTLKRALEDLARAFPGARIPESTIAVYVENLADLELGDVRQAVAEVIRGGTNWPTIWDLRCRAGNITSARECAAANARADQAEDERRAEVRRLAGLPEGERAVEFERLRTLAGDDYHRRRFASELATDVERHAYMSRALLDDTADTEMDADEDEPF